MAVKGGLQILAGILQRTDKGSNILIFKPRGCPSVEGIQIGTSNQVGSLTLQHVDMSKVVYNPALKAHFHQGIQSAGQFILLSSGTEGIQRNIHLLL